MTKQILGVGWDVGGWIGRKQGVAVVTNGPAGAAWLGAATSFSLGELGSPKWSLLEFIRIAWPEAPDDMLARHRVILAIDSPLAFPKGFKQLLDTGLAPDFQPDGPEIDNPLAYRDCDRQIYRVFKKKPLSASFDKLGNNATVAMLHARRLARLHRATVLPFDAHENEAHTIIEVYPALLKKPKDTCCYDVVQALLPSTSVAGSDESDACICALMALAFGSDGQRVGLPAPVPPGPSQLEAAKVEGWIYYIDPAAISASPLTV